jgi:hypothetical protein
VSALHDIVRGRWWHLCYAGVPPDLPGVLVLVLESLVLPTMIIRFSILISALLLVSARTTSSNKVLTENPWGNYTANVDPSGSTGR